MSDSLSFKKYKKSEDIHGTVLYPAPMIAPVQNRILREILSKAYINSIFDPFHGSGTALYEAMCIQPHLHLVGCDINPLANLITRVKLNGINISCIEDDIRQIKENADANIDYERIDFCKMHKWFRDDILESVFKMRNIISSIDDMQNRLFFWSIFSDYIRKYSNTRSSTYKLHIKPVDRINSMENNLIEKYIDSIATTKDKYTLSSSNYILYKNDILQKLEEFEDGEFDLSITSPPYGDNATTVPYGEFSMLPLHIIPSYDLELEGWELDNYSIIDSKSLGGRHSNYEMNEFEWNLINPYVSKIAKRKQTKVVRFFSDYFKFLTQLCRVTKKFIVLTLGNRTVDRIQIDLTGITKAFLEQNGFPSVLFAHRDIPHKRTPKLTSCVYESPVNSMTREFIMIHKQCFAA